MRRTRLNGFTGRAQNFAPPFTPRRERASGKALAFTRHVDYVGADFRIEIIPKVFFFFRSLARYRDAPQGVFGLSITSFVCTEKSRKFENPWEIIVRLTPKSP